MFGPLKNPWCLGLRQAHALEYFFFLNHFPFLLFKKTKQMMCRLIGANL
jgi:hypothetical protein